MITLSEFGNIGYFWLQNIPDLLIASDCSEASVVVSINSEDVFNETLVADENGNVILCNLAGIIEPFFGSRYKIRFKVNETWTTVFFSRRYRDEIGDNYEVFGGILNLPLSVNNLKYVRPGDNVDCYFLLNPNEERVFDVDAYVLDYDGNLSVNSSTMSVHNNVNDYNYGKLCIPTAEIMTASHAMSLLKPFCIVVMYNDKAVYCIRFISSQNHIQLSFINNYNLPETICLPGVLNESPKYDRIVGMIKNCSVTIHTDERIEYSFNCAPLAIDAVEQLMDAVSANDCACRIGYFFYSLKIDDCSMEIPSSRKEFITPKLSFTRSKNQAAIIH